MFWSGISARRWSNSVIAEHKKRTVCWCNQSQLRYSIIRVPQNYADLDGVVLSIGQVILCVFSGKYYGRINCSESRIAFFSCSSDVRVVLHWAGLSRYSMKVAIFYLVHSTQNKPYPSLCETYQSLYNQKYNNTNTQQKDFCFRIKVRFPDALRLGRVNLSRSVNPT